MSIEDKLEEMIRNRPSWKKISLYCVGLSVLALSVLADYRFNVTGLWPEVTKYPRIVRHVAESLSGKPNIDTIAENPIVDNPKQSTDDDYVNKIGTDPSSKVSHAGSSQQTIESKIIEQPKNEYIPPEEGVSSDGQLERRPHYDKEGSLQKKSYINENGEKRLVLPTPTIPQYDVENVVGKGRRSIIEPNELSDGTSQDNSCKDGRRIVLPESPKNQYNDKGEIPVKKPQFVKEDVIYMFVPFDGKLAYRDENGDLQYISGRQREDGALIFDNPDEIPYSRFVSYDHDGELVVLSMSHVRRKKIAQEAKGESGEFGLYKFKKKLADDLEETIRSGEIYEAIDKMKSEKFMRMIFTSVLSKPNLTKYAEDIMSYTASKSDDYYGLFEELLDQSSITKSMRCDLEKKLWQIAADNKAPILNLPLHSYEGEIGWDCDAPIMSRIKLQVMPDHDNYKPTPSVAAKLWWHEGKQAFRPEIKIYNLDCSADEAFSRISNIVTKDQLLSYLSSLHPKHPLQVDEGGNFGYKLYPKVVKLRFK